MFKFEIGLICVRFKSFMLIVLLGLLELLEIAIILEVTNDGFLQTLNARDILKEGRLSYGPIFLSLSGSTDLTTTASCFWFQLYFLSRSYTLSGT